MRLTSLLRYAEKLPIKRNKLSELIPMDLVVPRARGGAPYSPDTLKVIRLVLYGCANRPFYYIAVQEVSEPPYGKIIEQLGTYDALPNRYNEKIVSLNLSRIEHWLNEGVIISLAVKQLFGLAGYFPLHPVTLNKAWDNRKLLMETLAELEAADAEATAKQNSENAESSSPEEPAPSPA